MPDNSPIKNRPACSGGGEQERRKHVDRSKFGRDNLCDTPEGGDTI